ncbi:hypothetical protein ACFFX0_02845 [Citricoccus parietis]|uniref:Uncharacterized protein n=1 Tax=Citricoccus parietis TaxID=592307 RepID=A0ABV5FU21_9MICC
MSSHSNGSEPDSTIPAATSSSYPSAQYPSSVVSSGWVPFAVQRSLLWLRDSLATPSSSRDPKEYFDRIVSMTDSSDSSSTISWTASRMAAMYALIASSCSSRDCCVAV